MFAPVFAVLLAMSDSPSPEPPPTPTPEAQIEHRDGDGDKRESTPVAQPVVTPTQNAVETKQQRDNHDDKSSPDRTFKFLGLIFTGVIAASALVQIFAVYFQGRITRAQLRATQTSADAAMQSVQNVRVLNRAKVVIEQLRFEDVGISLRAFYKVRNIGKTTAYIYERIDTAQIIDNPLPDIPPALEWGTTREPFDLAPNRDDVTFGGGTVLKLSLDRDKFLDGEAELYAIGVIKYRDDFGSEWTTSYAWQHRRSGPAFPVAEAAYNRST